MGRRFTEILSAEWRGVLNKSWNSERPLVFSHVVLSLTCLLFALFGLMVLPLLVRSSAGVGGMPPPPEEHADFPGFTPERAHLLLREIYRDFPHHNDGSHLDRGVANDAIWQRCWRRLAAQSLS